MKIRLRKLLPDVGKRNFRMGTDSMAATSIPYKFLYDARAKELLIHLLVEKELIFSVFEATKDTFDKIIKI